MKKTKQQEELEEGLKDNEEIEEDEELEETTEDVEEPTEEVEPEAPVQKGLVLQTAPAQFEVTDRETGEAIVYSTSRETLPLEIAIKTLEYAREAYLNSIK